MRKLMEINLEIKLHKPQGQHKEPWLIVHSSWSVFHHFVCPTCFSASYVSVFFYVFLVICLVLYHVTTWHYRTKTGKTTIFLKSKFKITWKPLVMPFVIARALITVRAMQRCGGGLTCNHTSELAAHSLFKWYFLTLKYQMGKYF